MSEETGAYGTGKPQLPPLTRKPPEPIGMEVLPLATRLIEALKTEPNPLIQQKAIEVLAARHCMAAGNLREVRLVVAGVAKHIRQLTEQFWFYRHSEGE